MRTIREMLATAAELNSISDSARLDVEILLCDAMNKDRTYLYTWPEKKLTQNELDEFAKNFLRRQKGEPIAYIIGSKEFWSLTLECNKSTLIPRPETELLVELALSAFDDENHSDKNDTKEKKVLDLGTGTGAIALAIAKEKPHWQVTAIDSESSAVQLAIHNCRALGLLNVQIAKSHWFENLPHQTFDLIVSNPPYIKEDDVHLSQGDVRFEPQSALISGKSGLQDIEKIISGAQSHLNKHGVLMIEHGYDQAEDVRLLLKGNHFLSQESVKDLAGHERVTIGVMT
ncbi:MAG: peptide chain release factor N(5)-glutamine methyltransferase [Cellvibrionaceae bacterium]